MEPNINSFLSQTGCMIYQREGQRFCQTVEALEYIKLPGKGHEVYVGKLPRDCYEQEIYPMFSIAGDIYETRIMMGFSGSNRGFCYVKYFTRQAADNAVQLLHNQEIRPGHRLIVQKSLERIILTVYNVDERVDEITAAKSHWNTPPEEEMGACALPLDVQDQNNNVGGFYYFPRNSSEQEIITAFPRHSYLDNQTVEDSSMFAPNFTLGTHSAL